MATINGTSGNDTLSGTTVADTINGLDGNDTLKGGLGNDTLNGGNGEDTGSYAGAAGAVQVNLTAGTSAGADGVDTLTSIENVTGSTFNDTLDGGDGDDLLIAMPGLGNDILIGGAGIDTADFSNFGFNQNLRMEIVGGGYEGITGVENIIGTNFTDWILGNTTDNKLWGGGGNDQIEGGGGNDELYGGEGDDTISGGGPGNVPGAEASHDLYDGGTGTDMASLWNDAGAVTVDLRIAGSQFLGAIGWATFVSIESVYATAFDDNLTGNELDNKFFTDAGTDHVDGQGGNDFFILGLGDKAVDGGSGIDTLWIADLPTYPPYFIAPDLSISLKETGVQTTGAGNLTVTDVENLFGWRGNDRLTGDNAANTLDGQEGNDILWGGMGDDILIGGDGSDTARYTGAKGAVVVDLLAGSATGADGNDDLNSIESVIGTSFADTITGTSGANSLDGAGGADLMTGGGGNDTYVVDNAGDQVVEFSGGGADVVKSSIGYVLAANVEELILTGSADTSGTGNSLDNVITGNLGINILAGGAGNDTYIVGAGDQVVERADEGYDLVRSDVSFTLAANVEALTLLGNNDIDATGNDFDNAINGNAGSNVLNGGAGADVLKGGKGDDVYVVDSATDTVGEAAGGGTDTVNSSVSFIVGTYVENVTLTGSANINATGNYLSNVLIGNSGANFLDGRIGADILQGGAGNDTYVVDVASDQVIEAADEGVDLVRSTISWTLGANVENLLLLGGAIGTGNGLANTITGNSLANVLDGGAGADMLKGGAGDDTYVVDNIGDKIGETSTGGRDTVQSAVSFILGNYVENLILTGLADANGTGNSAANKLTGNAGANILDGRGGADEMNGGAGDDTYVVDNIGDTVIDIEGGMDTIKSSISLTAVLTNSAYADIETLILTGTDALDVFGNNLDNTIVGNSGDNWINGNTGNDLMKGGAGNDIYIVHDAGDRVVETSAGGVDTVHSYISHTLDSYVENLVLEGGDIDGAGNNLANTISGSSGANVIDGGTGADTMVGGMGDDTYIVDNAGDLAIETFDNGIFGLDTVLSSVSFTLGDYVENLFLTGTASIRGTGNSIGNVIAGNAGANTLAGLFGNDQLSGGDGNDSLSGGDNEDILIGDAGNDILQGGNGEDALVGGSGTDTLTGGAAGDLFVMNGLGSNNADTITDYSTVEDVIVLSKSVFENLAYDELAASAFQLGTSANDAGDRIIYDKATGNIYYDADGSGATAKQLFAKVTAGTNLTAADFYVADTPITGMVARSTKASMHTIDLPGVAEGADDSPPLSSWPHPHLLAGLPDHGYTGLWAASSLHWEPLI